MNALNVLRDASERDVIEWGVAARAFVEQDESGDQYFAHLLPDGALLSVVDGLGHGPHAAEVAKAAVAVMQAHSHEPVASLLRRCHEALRGTRGVVMSLAYFDAQRHRMTWLGIGNVNGLLLYAEPRDGQVREWLLLRGGVIGYNIPTLRPVTFSVVPGDTLILATDGLRSHFIEGVALDGTPQDIADEIMASHRRGTDDALVLAARYWGGDGEALSGK